VSKSAKRSSVSHSPLDEKRVQHTLAPIAPGASRTFTELGKVDHLGYLAVRVASRLLPIHFL
jgi:hypothetical protein